MEWTKITKASVISWTNISKAGSENVVHAGQPMGLLLSITYPSQTVISGWHDITKASGTSWTKITKAV